jgi:hypothetical protein
MDTLFVELITVKDSNIIRRDDNLQLNLNGLFSMPWSLVLAGGTDAETGH